MRPESSTLSPLSEISTTTFSLSTCSTFIRPPSFLMSSIALSVSEPDKQSSTVGSARPQIPQSRIRISMSGLPQVNLLQSTPVVSRFRDDDYHKQAGHSPAYSRLPAAHKRFQGITLVNNRRLLLFLCPCPK